MSNGTYNMKYICGNCGYKFVATLSQGVVAKGHGGACPNCGVKDGAEAIHFTPEPVTEKMSLGTRKVITEPKTYK
jgi:DNA-directed RNA polymerase subunit RPC12/RpoP